MYRKQRHRVVVEGSINLIVYITFVRVILVCSTYAHARAHGHRDKLPYYIAVSVRIVRDVMWRSFAPLRLSCAAAWTSKRTVRECVCASAFVGRTCASV